jgi:O-antigen/teichoic acid export membrane protein
LGSGVYGAISALPLGSALALSAGLLFLGGYLRASGPPLPKDLLGDTLRLSAGAFLAFGAYMILLNNDLLWVNRSSTPETAGIYASAVLLRRAFSLLPGAVIVILYPRMVASVVQRRLPDGLLLKAATAILFAGILLSLVFFTSGERILELTFGSDYTAAGALLGWMGVGVIGYSLSAMWMNLYLATRPWPFVLLLVLAAGLQNAFLAQFHAETSQVILIFCVVGWSLALSGLVLYLAWLRPALVHK